MSTTKYSPAVIYILSVIFALLILFANDSVWFQHNILDETKFKAVAVETLTMESSRKAIANEIIDRSLGQWPVLHDALQGPLESAISGFIDSQLSRTFIDKTVSVLYANVSGQEPQPILVDVKPILKYITLAASFLNPELGDKLNALKLPDSIGILNDKISTMFQKMDKFFGYAPLEVLLAGIILVFLIFSILIPATVKRLTWANMGAPP